MCDGKGRKLYTINEANGLCSNHVSYVAYDGHGVLWGATANGIFAIELPSIYSYFLPKDGMTGRALTITAFNGKIYVGDTNGLLWLKIGNINLLLRSIISVGRCAWGAMD